MRKRGDFNKITGLTQEEMLRSADGHLTELYKMVPAMNTHLHQCLERYDQKLKSLEDDVQFLREEIARLRNERILSAD